MDFPENFGGGFVQAEAVFGSCVVLSVGPLLSGRRARKNVSTTTTKIPWRAGAILVLSHGGPQPPSRSFATTDGISSHVRPSSSRPPLFAVFPPCCLKKNGTPCA